MKTTKKKMENDIKKKWKTNQSTKINLIGCDTIVNLPSLILLRGILFNIIQNSIAYRIDFHKHISI